MQLVADHGQSRALLRDRSLEKPKNKIAHSCIWAGAYSAYFILALVQQHITHAASIGFGSYADESSHYLSGLMLRDYFLSGLKQSPVDYVSNYYLHLPMIGIGHWPPVFYLLEAAWMLVFGYTRGDIIIFIAAITALTSFTVYLATRDVLSWPAAFVMGGIVQAIPIIRWSNSVVMTDVFTTIVILWAALSLGNFLNTEKTSDAIYFGLLASLALLTKPVAACLALVTIPAILFVRKPRLLKSPALGGAALMVAAVTAPWYLATWHLARYGSDGGSLGESLRLVAVGSITGAVRELNVVLLLFGVGVYLFFRKPNRDGVRAVLILLPISVVIILVLARVGVENRLLIPAMLPIIIVSADGVCWLSRSLAKSASFVKNASFRAWRTGLVAGALLLTYVVATPDKVRWITADEGLSRMVSKILSDGDAPTMVMVAGPNGASDGRMIATLAESMRVRPGNIVVRATKVFAVTNWNGTRYSCRVSRPEEVVEELDTDGISLLAIDTSPRWGKWWLHEQLLLDATLQYPERFQKIYSDDASGYALYRFAAKHQPTMPKAVLDDLKKKLDLNPFSRYQDSDSKN
jgi:hypothetical protein